MDPDTVSLDNRRRPLVLAIDMGSSAARCAAYDGAARVVTGMAARRPYHFSTGRDGRSIADPDALLVCLWDCIDTVLERLGPAADDIAAVGSCTFVSNMLGLDTSGRPVTPLTTYADTTSWTQAERLAAECDQETVRQRVGCYFHPSYLPSRFLLWQETQETLFNQVAVWTTLGDYLEQILFARSEGARMTYSAASWTGLLNRHSLDWDNPMIARLALDRATLPRLVDVTAHRSGLAAPFADRWPALRDVPWFPAIGDGAAANLGSARPDTPHTVVITLGTTGAVRVIMPGPLARIPDGLWCYRVDKDRLLPGGALTEGGNVYDWIHARMKLEASEGMEAALAAMAPDEHGLTFLPFLAGERSPGWRGSATATVHGITLATTPLDVLRAGMEAVALRLGLIFDQLVTLLPDTGREAIPIVAGGGALSASPAWTQMLTDVLGREVARCRLEGTATRGVALLVLEQLGINAGDRAATPTETVFRPDRQAHTIYSAARERQASLYGRIRDHDTQMGGNHDAS